MHPHRFAILRIALIALIAAVVWLFQPPQAFSNRLSFFDLKEAKNIYYPSLGKPGYYTLIVISTSWCEPCKYVKRKYPEYLKKYSNLYIKHLEYHVEPPTETKVFLSRLGLTGYPSFLLLNPQGYPILSDFGFNSVPRLIKALDERKFKEPTDQSPLEGSLTSPSPTTPIDRNQAIVQQPTKPQKEPSRIDPLTVIAFVLAGSATVAVVTVSVLLATQQDRKDKLALENKGGTFKIW